MNIFEEIKSHVSIKQVAEAYGLKINKGGMACCPFHNDRHPSMKIDSTHYHCFGCGAHGDAVGYVAQSYGISQYDAACKIVEDMHLAIAMNYQASEMGKGGYKEQEKQRELADNIMKKLNHWIFDTIEQLKECEALITRVNEDYIRKKPEMVFLSNDIAYLFQQQDKIGYWLDILCLGNNEEKRQPFLKDGKEVRRIAANIKRAGNEILGRNRKCAG